MQRDLPGPASGSRLDQRGQGHLVEPRPPLGRILPPHQSMVSDAGKTLQRAPSPEPVMASTRSAASLRAASMFGVPGRNDFSSAFPG